MRPRRTDSCAGLTYEFSSPVTAPFESTNAAELPLLCSRDSQGSPFSMRLLRSLANDCQSLFTLVPPLQVTAQCRTGAHSHCVHVRWHAHAHT